MLEEFSLHSYYARVVDVLSETVLPVIPDFVWDCLHGLNNYLQASGDLLLKADLQDQVLVGLIFWFVINLILIKVAWSIFGEDTTKLLSSKEKTKQHLKEE